MNGQIRRFAVPVAFAVLLSKSVGAADGYFDATWGNSGRIAFHSWLLGNTDAWTVTRVLPESNGNLLLLGYGREAIDYYWLGELLDDGTFVPTFGVSNGSGLTTSVALGLNAYIHPGGVALLPGGEYLVLSDPGSTEVRLDQTTAKASSLQAEQTYNEPGVLIDDAQGYVRANEALARQQDGKILSAGTGFAKAVNSGPALGVVRFNANLSIDTSFNATTSGGISYLGGNVVQAGATDDQADVTDVLLQADGRIVLVGVGSVAGSQHLEFARFNTDGTVDATFGQTGGGSALTPPGSVGTIQSVSGGSAALDRAGRILVAIGVKDPFNANSMALARITADGLLDTSFHGSGYTVFSISATCNALSATALAIDSAGRILVVGTCNLAAAADFIVVRFRGDGYLDASFGINGYSLGSFAAGGNVSSGTTITLDGGGRPIVGGAVDVAGNTEAGAARLTYDLIYTNDFEFAPRGCLPPDCL